MKKILLFVILSFVFVGCGNQRNKVDERYDNAVVIISEEVQETSAEKEELKANQAIFLESKTITSMFSVNEDKVKIAIEMGFPTISSELDIYTYEPKDSDCIEYEMDKLSPELENEMKHKGFDGIEVVYEETKYLWNDFFDELSVTEQVHVITASLKGNSIYEEDIIDENEKYQRYYDEEKGLYFEIQDLMIGNFLEEEEELSNVKTGYVCNYDLLEGTPLPTYNPIRIKSEEEVLCYYITLLEEEPILYMESIYQEKLYKKWIRIKDGILVKEYIFDKEGLLESKKEIRTVSEKEIAQIVFQEPQDIEYVDITLFLYSFSGGDLETLANAIEEKIPAKNTGILLSSETGETVTIFTSGLEEMILQNPVYYEKVFLESGEIRTLRYRNEERFYTICEELETIEVYDTSYREKKYFDFEDVGLLEVKETENGKNYCFYDTNHSSVSGLYSVYEYVIVGEELEQIRSYQIESIMDREPIREVLSYDISLIDYDENICDMNCMNTYEIIDHGEGSIDDGENAPFWFE
jgi:hypothetical protein